MKEQYAGKDAKEKILGHYDKVVGFLRRRTFNNVELSEDIAQETYFKACRAIDKGQVLEGKSVSWLFVIARNELINQSKKEKKTPTGQSLMEVAYCSDASFESVDREDLKDCVLDKVRGLSGIIGVNEFFMHHRDGLKYEEIAEIEGISIGTVKSRINRYRKIAWEAFTEKEIEHYRKEDFSKPSSDKFTDFSL